MEALAGLPPAQLTPRASLVQGGVAQRVSTASYLIARLLLRLSWMPLCGLGRRNKHVAASTIQGSGPVVGSKLGVGEHRLAPFLAAKDQTRARTTCEDRIAVPPTTISGGTTDARGSRHIVVWSESRLPCHQRHREPRVGYQAFGQPQPARRRISVWISPVKYPNTNQCNR